MNSNYKVCEVCGKPYKPKAKDTRSKYCNDCRKERKKESQRRNRRRLSNK